MSTIAIKQGYEYKTYLNDIYKATLDAPTESLNKDELYYPQYMQAAKCIDEITMRKNEYMTALRLEKERMDTLYRRSVYGDEQCLGNYDDEGYSNQRSKMAYPNNIIGFCARRGQGKTSAMLTMVRALIHKDERSNREKVIVEKFWNNAHRKNIASLEKTSDVIFGNTTHEERSPVINCQYFALGTIDPTTMEKRDSILEIIIARMLQKAQDIHQEMYVSDRRGSDSDTKDYRQLLRNFQDASQKVRALKHSRPVDDDEISKMNETDDNRSTKYAFIKLVENFLRYIGKDMMIIPVDDADLDPHRVYEVTEDLRKYCIVPGVIIMMAVHLDTLKTCIEQQYVKSYRYLLQTGYDTDHMKRYRCREMAERYVDKLIPDLHQIHLPYIDDKIRDGDAIKLVYYAGPDPGSRESKDLLAYPDVPEWYQDRLFRLIYEKTGVILIEKPGYLHNFMPTRYRELTHMLSFFSRMTDIKISGMYSLKNLIQYQYFGIAIQGEEKDEFIEHIDEYLDRRIRNIEQLESYLFQHWCPVNLTKNQCDKLNKIRTAPLEIKNKRTIDVLKTYCEMEHANEFHKKKDEKIFMDSDKIITFADVVDALKQVKKRLDSPFKFDLVYAIQMYYTIYMNKMVSVCLRQKKPFSTLETLTQGLLTPFSPRWSITTLENQQEIPEKTSKIWLIACNKEGQLEQSDEKCSKYSRFDPFRYLFYILEIQKENLENLLNRLDENEIQQKKMYIAQITSEALQYICNYDIQYATRKKIRGYKWNSCLSDVVSKLSLSFVNTINNNPLPITIEEIDKLTSDVANTGCQSLYGDIFVTLKNIKPYISNDSSTEKNRVETLFKMEDIQKFMSSFVTIAAELKAINSFNSRNQSRPSKKKK